MEMTSIIKLGELGGVLRGVTFRAEADFRPKGSDNSIELLRSNNIQNSSLLLSDTYNLSLEKVKREQILVEGDSLICMANGSKSLVGKSAYIDVDHSGIYTFGSFMGAFRPNDPKMGLFIKYVLQSEGFRSHINLILAGSSISNLTPSLIEDYEFILPATRERKAISDALSDVDDMIKTVELAIQKKKNVLQGFQQSLISGAYFENKGISFEMRQLQNLPVEIQRGQLITQTTKIDGTIPVVAGGMNAAYYNETANRTGTTITISASGANAGYVNLWRSDIWASDCSTISESHEYEVIYIYYVLKVKQQELYDSQYGGGQPHIRPKEIGEISIPWVAKADQLVLVEILESMSQEIEILENEKTKYESIKQGMAHDLLTGKVLLV